MLNSICYNRRGRRRVHKLKAGAKAVAKKVTGANRDLGTEYEKQKIKEVMNEMCATVKQAQLMNMGYLEFLSALAEFSKI